MAKCCDGPLDLAFAALSDPTRRGLLKQLSQGEASVTQLAEPFGVSLPTIHKHLRVLERAGFIAHEKRGRVRHVRLVQPLGRKCVGKRRAGPNPIGEVKEWIGQFEAWWDQRLARLKHQIESDL